MFEPLTVLYRRSILYYIFSKTFHTQIFGINIKCYNFMTFFVKLKQSYS